MRFVFFDLECCDGRNICEFGYVVTDEKFNQIERGCILINPEAEFGRVGTNRGDACRLAYSYSEYFESPSFPSYYERIKELFCTDDVRVFGYDTQGDYIFLMSACDRYNLPVFRFPHADVQKIYMDERGLTVKPSIDTALSDLGLQSRIGDIHNSADDSELTKDILRAVCRRSGLSLLGLGENFPDVGENEYYGYLYSKITRYSEFFSVLDGDRSGVLSRGTRKKFITGFVSDVAAVKSGDAPFAGKVVMTPSRFEYTHTAELFKMIQIVANGGGAYAKKADECNMYVAIDGGEDAPADKRLPYVKGKGARIVTEDEFYRIAKISEEELTNLKCYDFCKTFVDTCDDGRKRDGEDAVPADKMGESVSPTISELIAMRGHRRNK